MTLLSSGGTVYNSSPLNNSKILTVSSNQVMLLTFEFRSLKSTQLPLGSWKICVLSLAFIHEGYRSWLLEFNCCALRSLTTYKCLVWVNSQLSSSLVPVMGVGRFQTSAICISPSHSQLPRFYAAAVKTPPDKPSQLYFESLTHRIHEYNKTDITLCQ